MTESSDSFRDVELPFRGNRLRFVWLVFLAIPVIQIAGTDPTPLEVILQAVGLVAWMAIAFRTMSWPVRVLPAGGSLRGALPWVGALLGITVLLTVFGVSSWSVLFPAAAIFTVRMLPSRWLLIGVLVTSVVAVLGTLPGGVWTAVSVGGITFGLGVMMSMIRATMEANVKLRAAQDELARLAVADERLRFARDMHDLVGHSLSVIALKAELAGRVAVERPEEAQEHVADIERVARAALGEVREVVSGYRQPLLDAELAGARMALDAAGIELRVDQEPLDLAPELEAVLAWTVREGTTNVIRHSGATRCTIAVATGPAASTVEVADDGRGTDAGVDGGNGLVGLRERVADVHGAVDAGPLSTGGFRLRVTVPA